MGSVSRMKRYAESLWPDEEGCPRCGTVDTGRFFGGAEVCVDCVPVSREEARVWVARCRATLIGATLSAKLRSSSSSGEKEEEG